MRGSHPALPIVVVSASDRRDDVVHAIDLGALGFVPKCMSNESLLQALRVVISGGIYLPASVMRPPAGQESSPSAATPGWGPVPAGYLAPLSGERAEAALASLSLTTRQTEALALLLRGQSNKLIARALNLSVETIKDHVAAVLRTLNVSSRTQAVLAVSRMSHPGLLASWRDTPRDAAR
jgi:DNA-binding NarL/FixJ family response regulator